MLHFKFTVFNQTRRLQQNKPAKKSVASDGSFRAVRNHSVLQWFKVCFVIYHPPVLKTWGSAAGWDLSACHLPQLMNWHLNSSSTLSLVKLDYLHPISATSVEAVVDRRMKPNCLKTVTACHKVVFVSSQGFWQPQFSFFTFQPSQFNPAQ